MSLFGNVSLQRAFCKTCKDYSFIREGKFLCCGARFGDTPKSFVRVSEPAAKRKTPTTNEKRRILSEQDGRCFYCGVRLGSIRTRNGKSFMVKIHWDHKMPFAYSQNNHAGNFVAACHVCNGIKSSHIFSTVKEAQIELSSRRREKGYDF